MNSLLTDLFRRNARLSTLLSSVIASVMLACAVIPITSLLGLLSTGWPGPHLVGASFVVALEAMFSHRALDGRSFPQPEWLKYRLSEWVVILLGLKLLLYIQDGFSSLGQDLALWSQNFLRFFFSDDYAVALVLIFFVWMLANIFVEELDILEDDEVSLEVEGRSQAETSRANARRRLANLILLVGGFMLLLTAALRSDLNTSWFALPGMRLGVFNIMLYFLLGLVLLSMTQFSILRIGWLQEGVPLQPDLAWRWFYYSLIFLGVLALLSLVLPTGYSQGLLGLLRLLMGAAAYLISLIGFIITLPFFLILAFFARLLGDSQEEEPLPELPQPFIPPNQETGGALPWLDFLKCILFWVLFVAVIVYGLRQYLREHPELAAVLRGFRLFRLFDQFWAVLSGWIGGAGRKAVSAVQAGVKRIFSGRESHETAGRGGYLNPRKLTPRQQVIFYYLAMLRRAGERGLPRDPTQTPYEYARRLREKLESSLGKAEDGRGGETPETSETIAALTERFIEARYSLHPVSPEESGLVKRYWERIRQALQRLR